MSDMYVAVNRAKKQLYIVGTVLSFNEFYVDEFMINRGHAHEYPKTYAEIFKYVNDMLFSRSLENNKRIATDLFAMGIDIVVSYHGTGIYDIFNDAYLDYRYVGSVYDPDHDIGKTLRESLKED